MPGCITCLFNASWLTLFSFKYDTLPFKISCVYISFTLLALVNITAVCEFLKLADSFPEVVNHDLLLTVELSSLLPPPSFPHPLLKKNLCHIDVNQCDVKAGPIWICIETLKKGPSWGGIA